MAAEAQPLRIQWTTRAVRDMRRLAGPERRRIVAKVERYAEDPTSLANQVIQLAGGTCRRLRVGDYRVLFTTERGTTVVMVVMRVRHRREAYG